MTLSSLLNDYDKIMLDLDGCVWIGDELTPRAEDALRALRGSGKQLTFLTNDTRPTVEELVQKLWRLGVQTSVEEVVTVGTALRDHLSYVFPDGGLAYVSGSPAMVKFAKQGGFRVCEQLGSVEGANVVVVAGHYDFDYRELTLATQAVLAGAELIACGLDATFPMPDGPWPATGALVAAVEYATGVKAVNVGKPAPAIFETAIAAGTESSQIERSRVLMIGDRVDADVAGAHQIGIDAAVVLTGVSDREAALQGHAGKPPIAVADTLAQLVLES